MARLPRFPDLLTTANLCCGAGSVLLASQGQLTAACWLVFAGAAFDVLDGLAARALGGGSELGKQLDSLADMVTFGVAPAFIVALDPWHALLAVTDAQREYVPEVATSSAGILSDPLWAAVLAALVIVTASAWRLAKFNIDTRQTSGFLGLPTPANALFWASIGSISWGIGVVEGPLFTELMALFVTFAGSAIAKLMVAVLLGICMLSELPLPSLKFKHFKWQGNEVMYLLGGMGVLLLVLYGILAVPMLLFLYLLSPLWGRPFQKTP